jgi:cyclic pyranopterin phosphate synthase
VIRFPPLVAAQLAAQGWIATKGSLIDCAIIAGTMAVKRTSDLIPFCHPLPVNGVRFAIVPEGEHSLAIECEVRVSGRTGVEMEALTGVTVAALTVYDMCKALSSSIELGPFHLLEKRGGKRDYRHEGESLHTADEGR